MPATAMSSGRLFFLIAAMLLPLSAAAVTPTFTSTLSPTSTFSPSPTATRTGTATATPSATPNGTSTNTPTGTETPTASPSWTASPTASTTPTPTATPTLYLSLNVTAFAVPSPVVITGSLITLLVSVSNTGTASGNNLALTMSPVGAPVTYLSGPQPAPIDATPGSVQYLTYTYSASSLGNTVFTARAWADNSAWGGTRSSWGGGTSNAVTSVQPGGVVADFESGVVATSYGTGASVTNGAGSAISLAALGGGFPGGSTLWRCNISGTVAQDLGNSPYARLSLSLVPAAIPAPLDGWAIYQAASFAFRNNTPGISYRVVFETPLSVLDEGHYEHVFTPAGPGWETLTVYFPDAAGAPKLVQPLWAAPVGWSTSAIRCSIIRFEPVASVLGPLTFDLDLDDLTFGQPPTPTFTPSPSHSASYTATATDTITPTPSQTPSSASTSTITPTLTITPTPNLTQTSAALSATVTVNREKPKDGDSYAAPNPVRDGKCDIVFNMAKPGKSRVRLFQASGDQVGRASFDHRNSGTCRAPLDLHGYAPGVYFYIVDKAYDDGDREKLPMRKFIVTK